MLLKVFLNVIIKRTTYTTGIMLGFCREIKYTKLYFQNSIHSFVISNIIRTCSANGFVTLYILEMRDFSTRMTSSYILVVRSVSFILSM